MIYTAVHVGDQIQWKKAKPNHLLRTSEDDLADSNRDTLVGWVVLPDPIYVNYEKERRQNAPLAETKAHIKRL